MRVTPKFVLTYTDEGYPIGVALLERAGFGAREVADELLIRLRRSDEHILPVRLAPESGGSHDFH